MSRGCVCYLCKYLVTNHTCRTVKPNETISGYSKFRPDSTSTKSLIRKSIIVPATKPTKVSCLIISSLFIIEYSMFPVYCVELKISTKKEIHFWGIQSTSSDRNACGSWCVKFFSIIQLKILYFT